MLPQEIIRKKRDGVMLSDENIAEFITGVTKGGVTEAQISAFTMAAIAEASAQLPTG